MCVAILGADMYLPLEKKCTEVAIHGNGLQGLVNVNSPVAASDTKRNFLERSAGAKTPP